jgi:hypothetical protein
MREHINALPLPLAVVIWLNVGLSLLTAVGIAFSLWQGLLIDMPAAIVSLALALLTIGGILKKSRLVRMVILILCWINVPFLSVALIFWLFSAPLLALVAAIRCASSVLRYGA